VHLGAWGVNDETPPLLCLNSNPVFDAPGTVLNGQFDWGDLLPKGNLQLPSSPEMVSREFGYMLEHPSISGYEPARAVTTLECGQSAGKTECQLGILRDYTPNT
jgi:hypothetical protein